MLLVDFFANEGWLLALACIGMIFLIMRSAKD